MPTWVTVLIRRVPCARSAERRIVTECDRASSPCRCFVGAAPSHRYDRAGALSMRQRQVRGDQCAVRIRPRPCSRRRRPLRRGSRRRVWRGCSGRALARCARLMNSRSRSPRLELPRRAGAGPRPPAASGRTGRPARCIGGRAAVSASASASATASASGSARPAAQAAANAASPRPARAAATARSYGHGAAAAGHRSPRAAPRPRPQAGRPLGLTGQRGDARQTAQARRRSPACRRCSHRRARLSVYSAAARA